MTQEMNTSVGSGNDLGNEQSCEWKRKEKRFILNSEYRSRLLQARIQDFEMGGEFL